MGLAQQLGHPRGLVGALVGRGMARANADLSRWVVQRASDAHAGTVRKAAELGSGPGVGLEALLRQFSDAQVWGVDLSPVMLSQANKRNWLALAAGRLTLVKGDTSALAAAEPIDIVMANHVLYFWRDPRFEMAQIRRHLRAGGLLAVGYQLRQNMPGMAQRRFPPAGHLLYDSDDAVARLAEAAGYSSVWHQVKGSSDAPEGRVMLAAA